MRIEFDPTNPTEAAAVRAMLTATEVHMGTSADPVQIPDTPRFAVSQAAIDTLRVAPAYQVTTVPLEHNEDPSSLVNCDSNGEPHDPRIHSTPPKLNADGTWRAKRGVTAEQIALVRAERQAAPVADDPRVLEASGVHPDDVDHPAFTSEAPIAPLVEPAASAPAAPPAPPANAPSSTPTLAPTPPAPPVPAGMNAPSFLDVMKAITAAQKDGKIDTAKVKELCAAVGAGESTMGLNGPDNGDKRVAFMALLAREVAA